MPTYQYQCKNCGFELEELQSFTEDPLVRCPSCGTDNLTRILGGGGGLIFKGSGFYLTDYKKSGEKQESKPKKEEKKPDSSTTSTPADGKTPGSTTLPPSTKE